MPLSALSSAPWPWPLATGHQVESDSLEPETGSNSGTEPFQGQMVPANHRRGNTQPTARVRERHTKRWRRKTERVVVGGEVATHPRWSCADAAAPSSRARRRAERG